MEEKGMIPRHTIAQLVGHYTEAKRKVEQACALFVSAEQDMKLAFGDDSVTAYGFDFDSIIRNRQGDFEKPESFIGAMKQSVWRRLIDKCELRKVCTVKRAAEMDKQLEDIPNLPEITEANVTAMLKGNLEDLETILAELVKEVFNELRPTPGTQRAQAHKTNQLWEVGHRVILTYAVERRWNGPGFTMRRGSWGGKEALLRGLDNVMSILDGKGVVKSHYGPLYEAIDGCDRGELGETDYFRFRCFKNGNLHIEFKREDLLAELNRIGSGGLQHLKGTK